MDILKAILAWVGGLALVVIILAIIALIIMATFNLAKQSFRK